MPESTGSMKSLSGTVKVYGKEVRRKDLEKAAPELLYACIYFLDIFDNVKAPYRKRNLSLVANIARRAVRTSGVPERKQPA